MLNITLCIPVTGVVTILVTQQLVSDTFSERLTSSWSWKNRAPDFDTKAGNKPKPLQKLQRAPKAISSAPLLHLSYDAICM